jgi:DHA1 family bicyclomycin/chloramphenicol resistance-like MFS transporter
MDEVLKPANVSDLNAAQDPSTPRARVGWLLILLLGVLSAFTPVSIDMYLPAFPAIEKDLVAPPGAMSYTLSLFLVGLGIGQFVLGPVSDRFGRRWPVLIGCVVFAIASLSCAISPNVGWMIASRFLMGFSGAAGVVIARAVVRDLFDEKASAGMYSILMMIGGIAPIVGPLAGAAVLKYFHWPMVFWLMAAFGILCAAGTFVLLRETHPLSKRSRDPVDDILRRSIAIAIDPRFTGYALAMGFAMGAIFAFVSGSPDIFMKQFGISKGGYSLLFACNSIGLYIGNQVNRRLLKRMSAHRILRRASVVALILGGLLLLQSMTGIGGARGFIGLTFLCISIMGLIFPNAVAAAMAPFARHAGAASSMLGLTQYSIGAISGAVVGKLHTGTSLPMAAVLAGCELCVFLTVMMGERTRRAAVDAARTNDALLLSNAA